MPHQQNPLLTENGANKMSWTHPVVWETQPAPEGCVSCKARTYTFPLFLSHFGDWGAGKFCPEDQVVGCFETGRGLTI